MALRLFPRAAPSNSIRVWLGVTDITKAPPVTWQINGADGVPNVLRRLQSVRPTNGASRVRVDPKTPRTFTGVYEFSGLPPDTPVDVQVQVPGSGSGSLRVRTLPASIPTLKDNRWFNVLLVSCFHQAENREGLVTQALSRIPSPFKPHLTLLMGDQVYLDLPTLKNFKKDANWLAHKFEEDYLTNWINTQDYPKVLEMAPSVSLPDDHEFWNNYPHLSPFIQNSYTQEGRDNWEEASQITYRGFQSHEVNQEEVNQENVAKPGEYFILDIPPLSLFLADTRWHRKGSHQQSMKPSARKALQAWSKRIGNMGWYGVFVSGQSLYDEPAGTMAGSIGDYRLPNYDDFSTIIRDLVGLIDRGRPVMCLTGDVHWGRVTHTRDQRLEHGGRVALHEVIVSPLSLVSTIGVDQYKRVRGWIAGLFGKRDPWPRHSPPSAPPEFFARRTMQGGKDRLLLGRQFPNHQQHGQKGNQLAVLSFRQARGGVDYRVTYYPIHADHKQRQPVHLPITHLSVLS